MRVVCLLAAVAVALSAAPSRRVEILWDRYGVAHVYAKNVEGLFFGYGYASMQSHGDLILKLYGESRGRSSEYWGPGANDANLTLDRWVAMNDVAERGAEWYAKQTPEFRRYLDAYAAGMNEYATRHGDKLNAERKKVLPITGADPVIHTHRIMHFSYVSSWARVVTAATGRAPAVPGGIGSNAWAIAPKKSASGKAMILMNPHLPWQDWYTYYEIHLNAPGINLYGASQVGFPVLRFSMSDHLAFTQTVNSSDGSDLYEITRDGDGYRFDGAKRDFTTKTKSIKIAGRADEKLTVRHTVHGPVVWDRERRMLALRTAGLDRPFGLEQYWKMATARNFRDYEAQVRRLEVPTFNITYADRDGHVMYLFNAALPVRAKGDTAYWAGVLPGNTSETLWTKLHPYEDLPKVIDPSTGFVQNTNDPPWSSTYPPALDAANFPAYTSVGRTEAWRTIRSLRMLTEKDKLTFDDVVERKFSTRLELADRIVDDVVAAVEKTENGRAKKAAAILKAWDRQTESASRGALLFEAFARLFGQSFATPMDGAKPFDTPRGLKPDNGAVARMLEEAYAETERNFGAADASWGEWRRFKRGSLDLAGNGAPGSLGSFRVNTFLGAEKRKYAGMGDTFILIGEFSNPPRAKVLVGYGNSTQPGSKHIDDQLQLFADKKMRAAWRTRKEVESNLESREKF